MDRWVEFNQKRILEKIPLNGKTLLDIGCANGEYLQLFSEKLGKQNIAGLDIYATNVPGIKTVKASAEKIPFPDKSFDVVFEKDALHHVPNREKAFAEMKRVAKKEIILVEANLHNRVIDIFIDKRFHRHFSKETLAEFLKGEKYSISFIEAFPFGSNIIFPLKLLNYLPNFISNAIFYRIGKMLDFFEGEKATFIVCRISCR